nr:hypothetical protein [Planctomycetota bacterium]
MHERLTDAQQPTIQRVAGRVRVHSPFWTIEHDPAHGGAWTSLVFTHGSGSNLLRAPVSSAIKFAFADPESDGAFTIYHERNEHAAVLSVGTSEAGHPQVVAEGSYRDEAGATCAVRFRRTTEYRPHGLVHATLDVIGDPGRDDVVEVCAFDLALRPGLSDSFVRPHPSQIGGDLLGWGKWQDLRTTSGTAFQSPCAPLYVLCMERGVEGIEVSMPSELHAWDRGLKPDLGLGLYHLAHGPDGTALQLSPYCMAYRRRPVSVRGTTSFPLRIALPAIKPREQLFSTMFHAGIGSRWISDAQLGEWASAGVRLIRFHNDYRENGPFWHDGVYPPYDADGMRELRRIIDTCHRLGMRIVPYVSLKEFHPEAPGYAENHRAWMHMVAPSVDVIHTFMGSGEYGGVMCMRSSWKEFRQRAIDIMLNDLPWDGLYFDWTTPHPCKHPDHAVGEWHSDNDEFHEFLLWCRTRIGRDGYLFLHLSGTPSLVAENLCDLASVNEDAYGPNMAYRPGEHRPQCDFIPIVPHQLIANVGVEDTPAGLVPRYEDRRAHAIIAGCFLQGKPTNTDNAPGFARMVLAEMRLFAGLDLNSYAFHQASDRPLETGCADVYAAAFTARGRLLIYVANQGDAEHAGVLRFARAPELVGAGPTLRC